MTSSLNFGFFTVRSTQPRLQELRWDGLRLCCNLVPRNIVQSPLASLTSSNFVFASLPCARSTAIIDYVFVHQHAFIVWLYARIFELRFGFHQRHQRINLGNKFAQLVLCQRQCAEHFVAHKSTRRSNCLVAWQRRLPVHLAEYGRRKFRLQQLRSVAATIFVGAIKPRLHLQRHWELQPEDEHRLDVGFCELRVRSLQSAHHEELVDVFRECFHHHRQYVEHYREQLLHGDGCVEHQRLERRLRVEASTEQRNRWQEKSNQRRCTLVELINIASSIEAAAIGDRLLHNDERVHGAGDALLLLRAHGTAWVDALSASGFIGKRLH